MTLTATTAFRRPDHPQSDRHGYLEVQLFGEVNPAGKVVSVGAQVGREPAELSELERKVARAVLREVQARAAGVVPCSRYEPRG